MCCIGGCSGDVCSGIGRFVVDTVVGVGGDVGRGKMVMVVALLLVLDKAKFDHKFLC